MSSQDGVLRHTESQLRMPGLDVDLNAVPPSENQGWEGTSTHTMSQDRQDGTSMLDAPIDLEAYDDDDDVIISSPRAFAEAKYNSRKNRGLPVVDVDAEERSPQSNQTSCLSNQTNANSGIYVNLEDSSNLMFQPKRGRSRTLPPPPPKEPIFNCPICMGPFVEEMSTKCGHIFCKVCIRNAIAAQNKCPTCRGKITLKNIFRIYLPSTNSS
ncbi:uncharacterized protein [Primulina huaijiensis]|uniref:uncharacterized protein n=1 Tax=Primulina huaijiensis TaxID=1492673 RepID=UPI003CC7140B